VTLETSRSASFYWVPHCPDFLWGFAALIQCMRFSLRENRTRGYLQCSVAGNRGQAVLWLEWAALPALGTFLTVFSGLEHPSHPKFVVQCSISTKELLFQWIGNFCSCGKSFEESLQLR
jgi:hypothetical protein